MCKGELVCNISFIIFFQTFCFLDEMWRMLRAPKKEGKNEVSAVGYFHLTYTCIHEDVMQDGWSPIRINECI